MATPITVATPSPGLSDIVMAGFDAAWQYDTAAPLYSRKMIDQYNGQGIDIFLMLYGLGMKKAVDNTSGWDWERGYIQSPFTSNGIVSGAAGATITITLSAAYVDGNYSFPVIGETWKHVPSGVVGIILTKPAANQITIKPLKSTESFSVAAGDAFVQISTAWAQGTAQPESKQSFWQKFFWYTQIRKHTYQSTGTMLNIAPQWNTIDFAVGGNSKPLTGYFMEGMDNVEFYHLRDFAYSFFYGQVADNITGVQTSTGLNEQVAARGVTYDRGTTFEYADLINIGNITKKLFGPNTYMALMNPTDYQTLAADIKQELANTNISQTTEASLSQHYFGGNFEAMKAMTSTFMWQEVICENAVKYMLKENSIYNDPNGAGIEVSTANSFEGVNHFIPMGRVETRDGGFKPHVEFLYSSRGGYDRLFEASFDGRAADVPIGPYDYKAYYLTSESAWNFRGLTQFVITEPGLS